MIGAPPGEIASPDSIAPPDPTVGGIGGDVGIGGGGAVVAGAGAEGAVPGMSGTLVVGPSRAAFEAAVVEPSRAAVGMASPSGGGGVVSSANHEYRSPAMPGN
jgi:hypothetical protein